MTWIDTNKNIRENYHVHRIRKHKTKHRISQTTKKKTEIQKATENVNPSQLSENLDKQNSVKGEPQDLEKMENPFIDESLRTDNH